MIEYRLAYISFLYSKLAEADAEEDAPSPSHDMSPCDVDVSVDGLWMTRGYSSKVEAVTTIGLVTGKGLKNIGILRVKVRKILEN